MSQDGPTMVEFPIIATDVESVLAMQAHLLRDDNNDQVLRDVSATQLVEARRSAAAFVLHGPSAINCGKLRGSRRTALDIAAEVNDSPL